MITLIAGIAISAALHSQPAPSYHNDYTSSDDDPGYQIDGGGQPGVEHYPRVCGSDPLACGLHFDPGPGTWARPDREPYH